MKKVEAGGGKIAGKIVSILGVGVSSTLTSAVLRKIEEICATKVFVKPFIVVTANPEIIMLAQDDKKYLDILNSADLVIPDGVGLKLAHPFKEIIPGRKLTKELISLGLKVFYLGGKDGVAHEMAKKYGGEWDEGHQDIKSQFSITNFQSISNFKIQNSKIIAKINKYKPDVLLVAYGSPWETKWIWTHRNELKVKVAMGVGGTFDFLTGRVPLPPEWVSSMGCEWLWRLVREPWRWRRQLSLVRFVGKLLVN